MLERREFSPARNWTSRSLTVRESFGVVPAVSHPPQGKYVGSRFSRNSWRRGDVTVTTTDAAAARRLHPRVALAVLMAWAGLGLAGCETGGGSMFNGSWFGSDNSSQATESVAAAKPAQAQPALAKVAVAPIIGAPDGVAKQIQEEFSGAVERQHVNVSTAKDERVDYTLRGYIVAAKDKNGTKVSYIWDVTDSTGKRVNRITGEENVAGHASKDPWAAITPSVAQSVSGKAASSFVAWLQTQSGQGAVATTLSTGGQPAGIGATESAPRTPRTATKQGPAATQTSSTTTSSIGRDDQVAALVPAVTGAPGDGSKSLAAAIQRELSVKGVNLTDKPTPSAYRVEGTVVVGQAEGGKQPIQIEWLVRDPQGKKLGTVSQKNEIAEGSLDGPWGKVADQAAGAAVQGIVKLLPPGGKAIN